jgi:broad specificity phosphatase PhoE
MITKARRSYLLLSLFAFVFITGCRPCLIQSETTIVLVRHAEREVSTNQDPPLTAAGQQRAQALTNVVGQAGVTAIYITQFQRTQQTAQPLASNLNITPLVFTLGNNAQQHAQDLAQDILTNHQGQAVVVVGHSNTIPLVIQALGISPAPSIGEEDFDQVFIVVKHQSGATRLINGRYGP